MFPCFFVMSHRECLIFQWQKIDNLGSTFGNIAMILMLDKYSRLCFQSNDRPMLESSDPSSILFQSCHKNSCLNRQRQWILCKKKRNEKGKMKSKEGESKIIGQNLLLDENKWEIEIKMQDVITALANATKKWKQIVVLRKDLNWRVCPPLSGGCSVKNRILQNSDFQEYVYTGDPGIPQS